MSGIRPNRSQSSPASSYAFRDELGSEFVPVFLQLLIIFLLPIKPLEARDTDGQAMRHPPVSNDTSLSVCVLSAPKVSLFH